MPIASACYSVSCPTLHCAQLWTYRSIDYNMYAYECIHIYTYVYIHTCVCTCTCTCTCTYTYKYTLTCKNKYVHIHIHTHTGKYIYICIYTSHQKQRSVFCLVCCSTLYWFTVWCSELLYVAMHSVPRWLVGWAVCERAPHTRHSLWSMSRGCPVAVCYNMLQCDATCVGVVYCVAASCRVLQCVAVCQSVLQCVAACSRVLQSRSTSRSRPSVWYITYIHVYI